MSLPVLPDTNQLRAGLELFRTSIAERLSETLPLTFEQAFAGVDYGKKGEDFTVAEIAATIIEGFQPDEWIESIIFDRSFLRFRVNTTNIKVLNQVDPLSHSTPSGQLKYSSNNSGKGKKVIIEYSSPNIIKEFHLGHLQSTVIGAFLANLYKACGWEVISMNYLGDWGTQFSLVATGYEKYGSQEEYNNDPLMHLYNVYIKVTQDVEADPKKYQEAYNRLNIKFEVYTGESNVNKESMEKALGQLEHMGLISDREGAREVDLKKWNLMAPIVRKLDGTSTYIIRDIGGAIERYEQYKFDKMIYVVGSAQDFHLTQFFKVLELMGFPWAKNLLHINYRMVQGMSTRKGTMVFLDRIIKKAGDMMHEQMKKNEDKYAAVEDLETMSLEIAITGIKIQDMAAKQIPTTADTYSTKTLAMDNNNKNSNIPHTLAATRAGIHPAPPPIFSPTAAPTFAFGTIGPGVTENPSVDASASARPASASADVSVTVPMVARRVPALAGDDSSELPSFTRSEEKVGAVSLTKASWVDIDEGWTPVTHKTSRTHRERRSSLNRSEHTNSNASDLGSSSDESESTVARTTNEMSSEELDALVRRHEAIIVQYRAALMARTPASKATTKGQSTRDEGNAPSIESLAPEVTSSVTESKNNSSREPGSRRVTVEEIEDEDEFPYLNQAPKSSRTIIEDAGEDLIDLSSRASVAPDFRKLRRPYLPIRDLQRRYLNQSPA
ncbi:hypothetical protein B0H10DRAFT_1964408 [Mycena sp. CBHHK59/15]|nr:hypothetical protein B0H10DRAFT_1964408 [Mycena sp. CBHHK59/15]